MEKHFMLDIETTGIDPAKEDLLQIGVLEVEFDGRFWKPGRKEPIMATPKPEFAATPNPPHPAEKGSGT